MRVRRLLVASVIMALAGTAASVAQPLKVSARGAKTITLSDRVGKNQFTWSSDAPLEKIKGTAEGVGGTLTVDPQNLATLRGSISAQVSTMKTGNATRDGHLKGAQWLDAAKYPEITFTIASVSGIKVSGNKAKGTATGTFTMHGVSKQMSVPFSMTWLDESATTRKRAPGALVMFDAAFTVSLKDFKVVGTRGLVGSKVGETIAIKAKLFGSAS
ncbi:MAG TPA: YceI family protein [Candidatus Kapabacteria bacterium]|nr:YceI family protein [Candidatus Kapabacteria bacterium]